MRFIFLLILSSILSACASQLPYNFTQQDSTPELKKKINSGSAKIGPFGFSLGVGITLTADTQFISWKHEDKLATISGFGKLNFAGTAFVDVGYGTKDKMNSNMWVGVKYLLPKKQTILATTYQLYKPLLFT